MFVFHWLAFAWQKKPHLNVTWHENLQNNLKSSLEELRVTKTYQKRKRLDNNFTCLITRIADSMQQIDAIIFSGIIIQY